MYFVHSCFFLVAVRFVTFNHIFLSVGKTRRHTRTQKKTARQPTKGEQRKESDFFLRISREIKKNNNNGQKKKKKKRKKTLHNWILFMVFLGVFHSLSFFFGPDDCYFECMIFLCVRKSSLLLFTGIVRWFCQQKYLWCVIIGYIQFNFLHSISVHIIIFKQHRCVLIERFRNPTQFSYVKRILGFKMECIVILDTQKMTKQKL